MRFHACVISSADMLLRVSASSSDFTIFCASSGFFKIQSVSSRYACQNYALPDEWSRYVKRMMHKPGSGISAAEGKKIYEFLVYDSSVRKKAMVDEKLAKATPADKAAAEAKIKEVHDKYDD